MATTKDFARLGDIDGVANYILVRNDGYAVSENYAEAVALSSSIATTGKLCDSPFYEPYPDCSFNRTKL